MHRKYTKPSLRALAIAPATRFWVNSARLLIKTAQVSVYC